MIKAKENFTYYLEGRPLQIYSGSIFSLPEGDEEYLINTGKAEAYEGGGGGGDTGTSPRVRNVALNVDTLKLNETYSTINNWFTNNGDFVVLKLNGDTVGFFTGIGYSSREGKYWVRALAGVGAGDLKNSLFYCLTENDYPEYPDPESSN